MDSFGCEESTTRLFASPLRSAPPRLASPGARVVSRMSDGGGGGAWGDADDALTSIVGRLKVGHVRIRRLECNFAHLFLSNVFFLGLISFCKFCY
jgi:hypothetical protein